MAAKFPRLTRFFLNNKGAKIASLFLALVSWYAIQAVISFETVVSDIPLTIQVDDGWAILDRSAKTVDVLFRGSREDIRYLDRDQIKINVDIRGHSIKGASTVKLRTQDVKAPGAVRAVMIRPEDVTLRLDQEGERQLPVKADIQGVPPEGYEVEQVVCTPASVVVHGPRQRLDEIESVRTVPIDLEGRSRTFKKLKMQIVQPSETWVARVTPPDVEVEVTVVEHSSTREIAGVPVAVLVQSGSGKRIDVRPPEVRITLKGRSDLLKSAKPEDVTALVDCSGMQSGTSYDLPVRIQASPGLTAVSVEPPTVKVTIGDM